LILQTATSTLLEPYDLESRQLERIFGTLAARKVDYADLYFQYSRSEGWSLEEGIVKSGSFNIEQGVGVRAVSGEKTAFAYSDEISFHALEDAAKATRAIASAGQARVVKAGSRNLPKPLYAAVDPIASLPSEAKVALLEKLERKCRALDTRVTQVMESLGGEYEVVLIARADGQIADLPSVWQIDVCDHVPEAQNGLHLEHALLAGFREVEFLLPVFQRAALFQTLRKV
jgi:TldD protein